MIYDKLPFERIYKDNYQQMYRVAYSMVQDEEEARDAVSQVFAQMWQSKPDVAESAVTGYLLTAVRNQCLHTLDRRARQDQLKEELGREQRQPQDTGRRELLSELRRIIREHLTEQDRRVLALHFDEEKTYRETAQALGISTSAVNKHITQSLSKIRALLKIRKIRAAAILLVCVVSGLVWAATLYLRRDPVAEDAPSQPVGLPEALPSANDSEIDPVEDELLSCWDEETGMYVFDNKELQLIVEALRLLYPVEPVFINEESRHIRLYFTIVPKERSIEEIVTLLNTFYHIQMHLEEDKLIIE